MLIFKNFTYSEGNIKGNPVAIFTDEDGNDWYQSQKQFKADSLKVAFDKNGLIVAASFDVSTLAPANLSVAEIEKADIPDGFNSSGKQWQFNGTVITERCYTPEEIRRRAESQRQSLLSTANSTISLWQSELLLGSIGDEDKASLIKWITYIKAVKALDFSGITDEAGYNAIAWPEKL